MRNLLLVALLGLSSSAFSQLGTGEWRMHVAAAQAVDVAYGDGLALAALKTGVIEYDQAAGETKIYNDLNGLSDILVSCISYDPGTKSFFIGYDNGNIDQLYSDGSIVNIPAVKLAAITGNKRINSFTSRNGKVFAATGFAIIVLDPVKHEVKDTYNPFTSPKNYQSILFLNDSIYALHNDGMIKAFENNQLLGNPNNWTVDTRVDVPALDVIYQEAGVYNNEVYILAKKEAYGGDSIMKVTSGGLQEFIGHQFNMEIINFQIINNKFGVSFSDSYVLFNDDLSIFFGIPVYSNPSPEIRAVTYDGTNYWIADYKNGLVKYDTFGNAKIISKEGPPKNDFFSINGNDGKIVVTGGTIDRVVLSFSLSGAYTMQDETWSLYDKLNQPASWTSGVWDIGTAAINPKNLDEVAFGGYCTNGLSIATGSAITQVYGASNSILENTTLGNNMTCITSLEYDDDGNLWIVNGFANKPLKVRTADGSWYAMSTNSIVSGLYASELAIDYNGNKWVAVYGKGLMGYKDNGTISNTSDDIIKVLQTGTGSGNLPSETVTAVAVDFDNEIWIGTDNGLAVLYNSDGIFSAAGTTDASRILVTYDGNVEMLLGNSFISDIEIDGGNRKWIGTQESGVFLVSADGQEVLANFNKDNSPMISNLVLDMEFNHLTGELFIITDNGMVSYRTDATYEDPDYASTTVFPNPVKPDFFGPITIQGIKYGSDVKITDAAGNLVYKTTSNGGTATWNGKRLTGEEVSSGVYFIWTAPAEGKGKKVGKVVVIR
ncbi:two-component regulator propeller domain-containing protein [Fluviicola sp.]|uniref:type IX secretion system anionic LPS delivery protein PorZ n=1 Tax=Fluviicola sp. TaxID=1917219 RepID=UPI002617A403|nr:two-component regulator propeller domain-containing protein [Fluviicola sp.]